MALDINEQYDKIYRFCYLRVLNRETAEDLTQETFLRYLERPQYLNADKTLQLLYTIARNLCSDEFRRKKCEELPDDTLDDENIEDTLNVMAGINSVSRFALNRRIKKILNHLHNYMGKEEIL